MDLPAPHRAGPGPVSALPLLAYGAFIVYQSLADGGTWACGDVTFEVPRRFSRTDVLANVLAYVPLGWLCVVTATGAARWPASRLGIRLASVAAVSGLSLALEMLQSCQSARVSSASDWAANTVGATLGVILAAALPVLSRGFEPTRVLHPAEAGTGEARLRLATFAVVVLWVLSQCMPWVFAVDVGTVRKNLAFLRGWGAGPQLDAWSVLRHGGAWTAIAAACRLACRSRGGAAASALAAAAGSVVLQLLLDARSPLSSEELLAMAAVLAVFVASVALGGPSTLAPWWPRCLLVGLVAVLAAYQLEPAIGPTRDFSWLPLVGLGNRRSALEFAWLFAWAGCGTVVAARWAQRQRDRWHAARWPLLMMGLVLATELLQTQIPGRGPDTSALFFLGLAVLATRVVLREGN